MVINPCIDGDRYTAIWFKLNLRCDEAIWIPSVSSYQNKIEENLYLFLVVYRCSFLDSWQTYCKRIFSILFIFVFFVNRIWFIVYQVAFYNFVCMCNLLFICGNFLLIFVQQNQTVTIWAIQFDRQRISDVIRCFIFSDRSEIIMIVCTNGFYLLFCLMCYLW